MNSSSPSRRTIRWFQRGTHVSLIIESRPGDDGAALSPPGVVTATTLCIGADLKLELHAPVIFAPLPSSRDCSSSAFVLRLEKAKSGRPYWPALLSTGCAATASVMVKVDWDRWVDEEDEEGFDDGGPSGTPPQGERGVLPFGSPSDDDEEEEDAKCDPCDP